jgi:hypothetical protein
MQPDKTALCTSAKQGEGAAEGPVVGFSRYVDAPALKEPDELEAARYFGNCCRAASPLGKRRKR